MTFIKCVHCFCKHPHERWWDVDECCACGYMIWYPREMPNPEK